MTILKPKNSNLFLFRTTNKQVRLSINHTDGTSTQVMITVGRINLVKREVVLHFNAPPNVKIDREELLKE